MVKLMTADAGYISRENCDVIGSAGAVPRIFPKKNVSYWDPWREMIYEFIYDTPKWLEQYHMRSVIETVNSTLKRTMPIKKKLVVRKATEIAARICIYNLRQLVYLKYTKG
jgi:transposase